MDKNKWLRVGVGILVLFLAGVFLKLARPILVPFALALLFSFAVSPALDFLVRRKVPKAVALVIILILSFAALYLMGTVFYSGGKSLAAELPSYTEMVRAFLGKIDTLVPDPRLKVGLTEWIQGFNIGSAGTFLLSALGPFFSFMSDLLLVFVFMTFILAGRGRMARKFDEA
ncbi:MAG: AI-2E family transporter, partial [Candidatus Aminicenantes bacterium]